MRGEIQKENIEKRRLKNKEVSWGGSWGHMGYGALGAVTVIS